MRNLNRVVSLILLAAGGVVIWEINGLKAIGSYGPGPKIMPQVLAYILIVLSVVNFVLGERKIEKDETVFSENVKKVLVVTGLIILYFLAIGWLGFSISNFIFLLVLMGIVEKMKPTRALVTSTGFAVLIHLMFDVWLQVDLPQGLLERLIS